MRNLFIVYLTLLSISSFAQTSKLIELKWQENSIITPDKIEVKTIGFNSANYNYQNWLPYYSYLHKTAKTNYNVELINTQYLPLSSRESALLSKNKISHNINITTKNVSIRKINHLQITFTPLRKNPTSGQIEKLIRFQLKLKQIGSISQTKSSRYYARNSLLSSGKWIKIAVDTSAIFKLSYEELIKMGISNPSNIRIFGQAGMLSKYNSDPQKDDLKEIQIYKNTGNDGIFNSGDFILFYAKGPRTWKYDTSKKEFVHQNHSYSDLSYLFLSSDHGNSSLIPINNSNLKANNTVNQFTDYKTFDRDNKNLLETGRLWVGDEFDVTTKHSYSFNFPDLVSNAKMKISVNILARSSSSSSYNLKYNNNTIETINMSPISVGSYTSNYADQKEKTFSNFTSPTNQFKIDIEYNKNSPSSKGWLNFIRINARRNLNFTGSQMAFRDPESVGTTTISKFQINNCNSTSVVWEITNQNSIQQIPLTINGNYGEFTTSTNSLREFVVFNPNSNFPSPTIIGQVTNQNLHALSAKDLIIVTAPKFASYANQVANFHKNIDQLKTVVVLPEQIYNEFSSGTPDVSAIRNFIKMFYDRAGNEEEMPKYLLLFGDGSFDNKSKNEKNTNHILTYQSVNSLSPTQSFVTDDFFGLLDDNEGEANGLVDIGIGRLPVNSKEEAQSVTSKILNYHLAPKDKWRTKVCFIGDDEDNNTHMRDANKLAVKVEKNHSNFIVNRIFLDDFQQVTNSAGQAYPDVNKKINETINSGSLILNYTGHGNENGLAHEKIMMLDDITSWKNENKLPLFMTATCEFSRFDNYNKLSAGEVVLTRNKGGSIALFTTTRLVYSSPNFALNQNFYDFVFKRNSKNKFDRLGDIMRKTKNATASGINKRNFTLLGDPALRLNYPKNEISTTKINDIAITSKIDTLKALSEIKLSGEIQDQQGNLLSSFNGEIYPTVYDKKSSSTTLGNDGNTFEYTTQNSILFNGKASVKNGIFNFHFFVPKDINYQYGNGKIHYYAKSNDSDASGANHSIIVGGTNPNANNDKVGPEMQLYMNDEQFISGEKTDQNPLLLAKIEDESGINTVKNSIGHNISAILDDKNENTINLNTYYEADIDTYKKGKISYQLNNLKTGEHKIKVKVWDNVNNSSENTLDFIVSDDAGIAISHLLNYPNPFTTNTGFYFEHNQGSNELDILIQILTVSGKLIKTIETTLIPNTKRVGPIKWDGKDDFGDSIGRGVYFYRVKVRNQDGESVNKFQKLVILK